MTEDDVDATLLSATGRTSRQRALAWIGDGHPLAAGSDLHRVTCAVLGAAALGVPARPALERLTREVASSALDPAALLHRSDLLPDASIFRRALDTLADVSGGSLTEMTAASVRVAQSRDSHAMETLEAVVGLTHGELSERVPGLPNEASRPWTNVAINNAFSYIDAMVCGQLEAPTIPGAFLPLPVELQPAIAGAQAVEGWARLEKLRTHGTPYELMLAQRAVGSSWGQHRNRTSQAPMRAVAIELRDLLLGDGFDVVLSDKYGGDVRQELLNELVGGDKHVNLIVRTAKPERRPILVVTFSLAKDGGSARKTLSAKLQMKQPRVPVAVVVLGGGFAARKETVGLVEHFAGAVYSEKSLDAIVTAAHAAATT